jgi:hypothetical protein
MLRVGKCKLQALAAAATLAAPIIGLAQNNGTWQNSVSGDWNITSNWNGVVFPGAGGAAVLPDPVTNININLPAGFGTTLSNIDFQADGFLGYSLTGAGSITLTRLPNGDPEDPDDDAIINVAGGGTGTINVQLSTAQNADVFKTGGGTLILGGTNAFGAGTGLQVNGGVLQVNSSSSLTNVAAITTGTGGQFILNNASVTSAAVGGLGNNADGAVRSLSGNNTWNGFWFIVAPTSVRVDSGSLTLTGPMIDSPATAVNGFTKLGTGVFTTGQVALNGGVTVSEGTLQLKQNVSPNSVSHTVGTLTVADGGVVDMTNNKLLITANSGGEAALRTALVNGYNGGAWNGTSGGAINSSIAAGASHALGYANGSDGVVAGLGAGQLLVMYTRQGDTNLSGLVDFTDFQLLLGNFNTGLKWDQGDFNYSGTVDFTDFQLLLGNFNSAASLPVSTLAVMDSFAADNGYSLVANAAGGLDAVPVPEPTSALLLAFGAAAGIMGKRRRRAE